MVRALSGAIDSPIARRLGHTEDDMKTHLLFIGAAMLAACGGQTAQTPEPTLASAQETRANWPINGPGTDRFIGIDLGPDSFAECQRISPKFPFGSAVTFAEDRSQISALANCLNAPSMRGRTVLLIGRTDAHGSDSYNEKLGMRRAEAIRQLLVEEGVAPSRIEIKTEGAMAAMAGIGEFEEGYDRRVDIILRGGVHAP
jgi:outer membrane protein OmpA-like peptidoglycan-associated protein